MQFKTKSETLQALNRDTLGAATMKDLDDTLKSGRAMEKLSTWVLWAARGNALDRVLDWVEEIVDAEAPRYGGDSPIHRKMTVSRYLRHLCENKHWSSRQAERLIGFVRAKGLIYAREDYNTVRGDVYASSLPFGSCSFEYLCDVITSIDKTSSEIDQLIKNCAECSIEETLRSVGDFNKAVPIVPKMKPMFRQQRLSCTIEELTEALFNWRSLEQGAKEMFKYFNVPQEVIDTLPIEILETLPFEFFNKSLGHYATWITKLVARLSAEHMYKLIVNTPDATTLDLDINLLEYVPEELKMEWCEDIFRSRELILHYCSNEEFKKYLINGGLYSDSAITPNRIDACDPETLEMIYRKSSQVPIKQRVVTLLKGDGKQLASLVKHSWA